MSYNPVTRNAALNDNTSANYIVHAKKPAFA